MALGGIFSFVAPSSLLLLTPDPSLTYLPSFPPASASTRPLSRHPPSDPPRSALFQTLLLPRLHFTHGTSLLYTFFLSFYPFVFALPPLIALTPVGAWRWVGVGMLVMSVRIGAMGFP